MSESSKVIKRYGGLSRRKQELSGRDTVFMGVMECGALERGALERVVACRIVSVQTGEHADGAATKVLTEGNKGNEARKEANRGIG